MNCKHCGAQVQPEDKLCPDCGKKLKDSSIVWKILVAVLCVVLLLNVLVVAVLFGLGWRFTIPGVTDQEPSTTEGVTVSFDSYTVEDDIAKQKSGEVVATAGDLTLTNAELQFRYWAQVSSFLNTYSYSLDALGMDVYTPFSEQVCYFDNTMTWEQYFLERAINEWYSYASLWLAAQDEGFVLSEESNAVIAAIADRFAEDALSFGYSSVDEMILKEAGAAATLEGFVSYQAMYEKTLSYLESLMPSDDEVEAFYAEHEAEYVEQGYGKDDGYLVDVRHILIMPETSGTNESGSAISTEEDWTNCHAEAQKIYDQWKKGEATEESFAELANEFSMDSGSNTNGGLYTGVAQGDMVEPFDTWIFDAKRVEGNHGLVKTDYGYHIMFFVNSEEKWRMAAENDFVSEMTAQILEAAKEKYPVTVNKENVVLGKVDLFG